MSSKIRAGFVSLPILTLLYFMLPATASEAFPGSRSEILTKIAGDSRLLNGGQLLAPLLETENEIKVIVSLSRSAQAKDLSRSRPESKRTDKGSVFYDLKDKKVKQKLRDTVASRLTEFIEKVSPGKVHVRKRFKYTFGFAATVTAEGLEELLAQPGLDSISEDLRLQPHTRQGISLISGETPRSEYDGSGIAIAIVDTGIDTTHPGLGNSATFPNAKVIGGYDTGDDDADPRPNLNSGEAHGTACAGIAAGENTTIGDYIGGVAPGAKLYALKISAGDSNSALASSMIAAWEWCVTHQYDDPNAPLLIISTSFGGGKYSSACNSEIPDMTQAAANALSAGITLFASAGNDGYCDSISWPACISSVNSVGAVYDAAFGDYFPCISSSSCADKIFTVACGEYNYYTIDSTSADMVTSYSNSASFLTLFAPSNMAYTTDISGSGGYSNGDYITSFGGTSAASPYAAGAAAVLQHAAKTKTGNYLLPEQVQSYLTNYGDAVIDSKVAISKARVNIANMVNNVPPGTTYTITASSGANGTIAPSGEIIVAEDGEQSFSIQADLGYRVKNVTIDNNSIGATGSYTFSSIKADHIITASFEARPKSPFYWWLPFIRAIISK